MLYTQNILGERKRFDKVMGIAEKYVVQPGEAKPDPNNPIFTDKVKERIFGIANPDAKLEEIKRMIGMYLRPNFEVVKFDMEFIVGMLYPKLDFQVSAGTNHLLKAPFNIHSSSLALSVPLIDVRNFDIKNCIHLRDLVHDNDPFNTPKGRLNHSYMDYIRNFEQFCERLEKSRDEDEADEEDEEQKRFEFDWEDNVGVGGRVNGVH